MKMNDMNNSYQNNQQNNYGYVGMDYPQQNVNLQSDNQYQNLYGQQPEKKKRFKFPKVDWSRFIGGAIALILIGVGISIFDSNKADKLIGTWAYTYEIEFSDGYRFDLTENLVITEGHYAWEIDEEKTKEAMMSMYDEIIIDKGLTVDDIVASGYESVQDMKEKIVDEDYIAIEEHIGEDSGTWRIEKGKFIFMRTGSAQEFTTDYELDGDTLMLIQDDITLTKVK